MRKSVKKVLSVLAVVSVIGGVALAVTGGGTGTGTGDKPTKLGFAAHTVTALA